MPILSFVDKATFIDVLPLKRRNAIAHGKDTFVAVENFEEITTETTAIMRAFGDSLDYHIREKKYKSK